MLKPLILSEWKSKTPALQLLSKYLLTCYQCCGFALHKLSHFHHTLKHLDFVSVWQNPVTEQSKKVKEVGAVFLNVKKEKKKALFPLLSSDGAFNTYSREPSWWMLQLVYRCPPDSAHLTFPAFCLPYGDLNRSEPLLPSSALPSGNAALLTLQAAAVRVGWVGAGPALLAHRLSHSLCW